MTPTTRTTREIHLRSRPGDGLPTLGNFILARRETAPPGPGEILVRNHWMSVDPYMRGRMNAGESYIAPFQLGAPLEGLAVGVVIASGDAAFKVGDAVSHFLGWREHALVNAATATIVDADDMPLQTYLGLLGLPGHAAWFGLLCLGRPKPGETVFVSAAGGAVGSAVAQMAKLKGCRVIGSVGSDEKARWLVDELGIDQVINYKREPDLEAALRRAAPEGIDVYFDNVGGAHLAAAIAVANDYARFPLCGMVAQYNGAPSGPSNIYAVVEKSLMLQGFIGINHLDTWSAFNDEVGAWIRGGAIKSRESIVAGLEQAPAALIGLFRGDNVGKMIVDLR